MNWQKIETAPKDGTRILACVKGNSERPERCEVFSIDRPRLANIVSFFTASSAMDAYTTCARLEGIALELKRAKEVLEGMDLDIFNAQELARYPAKYRPAISIIHGVSIYMDRVLPYPLHLEAIATWMRDPEGVVKA